MHNKQRKKGPDCKYEGCYLKGNSWRNTSRWAIWEKLSVRRMDSWAYTILWTALSGKKDILLNKNLLTSEKPVPQEPALKKINGLNTFTTCPPSVINCTDWVSDCAAAIKWTKFQELKIYGNHWDKSKVGNGMKSIEKHAFEISLTSSVEIIFHTCSKFFQLYL